MLPSSGWGKESLYACNRKLIGGSSVFNASSFSGIGLSHHRRENAWIANDSIPRHCQWLRNEPSPQLMRSTRNWFQFQFQCQQFLFVLLSIPFPSRTLHIVALTRSATKLLLFHMPLESFIFHRRKLARAKSMTPTRTQYDRVSMLQDMGKYWSFLWNQIFFFYLRIVHVRVPHFWLVF